MFTLFAKRRARREEHRRLEAAYWALADELLGYWPPGGSSEEGTSSPFVAQGVRGVGGRLDPPHLAVTIEWGRKLPDGIPTSYRGFPVVVEMPPPQWLRPLAASPAA